MTTLSVIYDVTQECPWTCEICAVSAGPSSRRPELGREGKLSVAANLGGSDCRLDLSGGEVLLRPEEHLPVIREFSRILGRERLGLSCSGFNVTERLAGELSPLMAEVELTMDAVPGMHYPLRPKGYHATAMRAASLLKAAGLRVGLQTVLTRHHLERPALLRRLRRLMADLRIDQWSLLRFFKAGRARKLHGLELSDQENLGLVRLAQRLCADAPGLLDVSYLLPGTPKDTGCRCVKRSVGVMPNGEVTACFWAVDEGGAVDPAYSLGDLSSESLGSILASPKADRFRSYNGGCALQ
jgi:MoaA/NifB/PqqE/SkfB family radical SAM enzyme